MARIALSGYYGFHNIGDEAILDALICALRRHQPDVELIVFSFDPSHTSRTYGVEAVSRTHLPSVTRALRRADLLVSGGGGLLQDVTSIRSVPYYLGIMEMAMLLRTRVAVYAQGIGPLRNRFNCRWVKSVLSRVDFVSVRDRASAQFLAALGLKREIKITSDPVFFFEPPTREEVEAFWEAHDVKISRNEPLVGIVLRPYPGETAFDRKIMDVIGRGCNYLEREFGARLVFLPCHLQKDLPLARELASQSSSRSVIFEKNLSPREVLSLVGGLNLMIGMRLHALIFAAICGVPFIALPYDPKVNAFLKYMGEKQPPPLEELTFQQLLKGLEGALYHQNPHRQKMRALLEKRRRQVEEDTLKLLSLVN